MTVVLVKCEYQIEVEYPDEITDERLHWIVEENGCPGTGNVGAAFDKMNEECGETSTCWACALKGENKIVSIKRKEQQNGKQA